jgi:hypothetical protein
MVYDDLQKRLNIMLNGKDFRDDTIYFVKSMVESIKVEDVLKTFLTLNGRVTSGENYVKLIQSEFKIQNWELFVNQIKEKLIEGAQYFVENKDWNISSNNYGKPLSTPRDLELSVAKIVETLNSILIKVIDKYLPKRTYQEENILTLDEQITLDEVKQLLKTVTSGTKYDTDAFDNSQFVVKGCTNPNAKNYNPLAKEDDGSCVFETNTTIIANPTPTTELVTKTWYGWKDGSTAKYVNESGGQMQKFNEYDKFTLKYYEGSIKLTEGSDIRETPKPAGSTSSSAPTNEQGGDGSQFGPTTTTGGASGPTLPTDTQEDTRGQTGQFNPGLAPGSRPGRGGIQ